MGDSGQPPGAVTSKPPEPSSQQSTTPAQAGGGPDNLPRRMRTFEEIINEEKQDRNILIVKLTKIVKFVDGKEEKPMNLSMEDMGEFFFEVVKLQHEHCAGLSLSTQRYDTKEIKLKSHVDPTIYITKTPYEYKGHEITISKQKTDTIKVTFRNVPWDIPDEEIINLCQVYGTPLNNQVNYEQMPKAYRGLRGPTRAVDMKMTPGKQFENFYWMEGR